jgi:hypothetical protein
VIPAEVTQTPWHYTTFWDWVDHWQTLIAGLAALLAALIAVGGSEWRARKALRASLASEIRLYVDLLIKTREILKRLEPEFFLESAGERQGDLATLAILHPPTVYPAAAAGTMGLLRRPRAAAVIEFYTTIERLNFAARAISNEPDKKVSLGNYFTLIGVIEQACRRSLLLLSEFPFDKRDANFRAEIAKWDAEAGAATIKTGITQTALDAIAACRTGWRSALTARWLNTIGLVLGIAGVLIIFRWGPPQPNFDEWVSLSLEGPEFEHMVEDVRRLKRQHEIMSSIGLGLIGLGFGAQLAAVLRAPA